MITLDGKPVLEMRLTLPLSGAWVASLELDSEDEVSGAVELAQSDTTVAFAGFVTSCNVLGGSAFVQLLGGAGGLANDVPAKSYRDVNARSVVAELLAAVGESLASSSTSSVLATQLPFWTRALGRASLALSEVARQLSANWRVLPDGSVWFGQEDWPATSLQVLELDRDARAAIVTVDADDISLVPGVTLGSDRVGRVEHLFGRNQQPVTTYWVEP